MKSAESFPSYRAPQGDRQILCAPPWPTVSAQLGNQRDAIVGSSIDVGGVRLAELTHTARNELIARANAYTRAYVDEGESLSDEGPLVITGHQPGLVHPGVWLKNFAASLLAQQAGGAAIHLIIDNDLCRSPSIRVPTGTVERPQVVDVHFDRSQQEVPWEERTIADRPLWTSFGQRVAKTIEPLLSEPLINEWWPHVVSQAESAPQLGLAITRARHRLERSWGNRSLEIPQSQVCQTSAFQRFALHLWVNAAKLRGDYNEALAVYRQAHALRNAAQPLPDLAEVEGWIETPFWVWTEQEPTRRALYVLANAAGLTLSDGQQWQDTLPIDTDAALQTLVEWENRGRKIRSRALITTLYARLLLADLFVHGIGGAKYDQVTQLLCQQFFGIDLPPLMAMSGTLRLPIEHNSIPTTRATQLRQSLRELRYHPETCVPQLELDPAKQSQADALVAEKQRWVQTAKTAANATQRHTQIEAANAGLQPLLQSKRSQLEDELAFTIAQTRANQMLESREYPFCLFPRELLYDFLLDFSHRMP